MTRTEEDFNAARRRSQKGNSSKLFLYLADGTHTTASALSKLSGISRTTLLDRYRGLRQKGEPVTIESLIKGPSK